MELPWRREFGRIDILVNNAAILRADYILDCPPENWQAVFRVNMKGTFLCSQRAAGDQETGQVDCVSPW